MVFQIEKIKIVEAINIHHNNKFMHLNCLSLTFKLDKIFFLQNAI